MFIADNIKLATRNFKTRKLRTFLTILGISVGISTILFLVSLGYGLQRVLLEGISTSDTLLTLDITPADSALVKIDEGILAEFRGHEGVAEVSPTKTITAQFKINDIVSNVTLNSIHENYFRLSGMKTIAGDLFISDKEKSLIVSVGTLRSLDMENPESGLGKEIRVNLLIPREDNKGAEGELIQESEVIELSEDFKIVGVVEDETNSFAYIPAGWVEEFPKLRNYDGIKVKVKSQDLLDPIKSIAIDKGYAVAALSDTIDQANKIFNAIQIILAMFGVVALIVSAIGMFNTMTIALLERTTEIGIMKSIGATNKEIKFLFLTESLIIGLLGGIGGVVLGLVGCEIVNGIFNLLARNLGGKTLDVFYTPFWFASVVLLFSSVVGIITGVYPAQRASRLNSLEALRYK